MSRSADDDDGLVGRYVLYDELASGGMATVHLARMRGAVGFGRIVAIKRLHAQFAKDPEFVTMFIDEARLASRIRHPNVVPTLDVVARAQELFVVMDYVHGESLAMLWRAAVARGTRVPAKIAVAAVTGVLHGLHAAHEARDERGAPLQVVHRDVSPQNILVGADGVARILDFGVARAAWRVHTTRDGRIKGKLRYMAPEQLRGGRVDRRVDVFAASIVLWEMLTGRRLFEGDEPEVYATRLLNAEVFPPPRSIVQELPAELDAVVMRGLAFEPDNRYPDAREMATALEEALAPATSREISDWMEATVGPILAARAARVTALENLPLPPSEEGIEVASSKVASADARRMRAQMTTAAFLDAPLDRTLTEVEAPPAVAVARAPAVTGRRGRAATLMAVVLLGAGGWGAWAAVHRSRPTGKGSVASGEEVVSSASNTAVASALVTASAPAPIPSGFAIAPPSQSSAPSRPRPTPPSRPVPPRVPGTPPTASASPKTKPNACMKQRPDGVVYFEPCP
jgi:serine/threonine-protein kinase